MSKLPVVPFRDLAKIAEALGYVRVRRKGSHVMFRRPDGQTIPIPDHGSTDLLRPLIHRIIRDMGLSVDEYVKMLDDL